jgi:NAD(P)H dehydrogenase (quinone)
MKSNILVVFYSMYGHIYRMSEAIAQGARSVKDVDVKILRVAELVPEEILVKSGASEHQKAFKHIPIAKPDDLLQADGIIFGTPTRFGNMCAQMRNFLDQTGGLWARDALVGKIGSVFASTGTQHGGQETTITSFHTTLFHLGMIVVGVPYSEKRLVIMDEVTGGTPYGATTLAGEGGRLPSENELAIAEFQGKHVATITQQLKKGRS